jgi:pyridoxine 5'-phosphate synthase PdxJ
MIPITKEQYSIYLKELKRVKKAQSRLGVWLNTVMAGHGITQGNVEAITPEGIVLREDVKEGKPEG